MKVSVTQCCPVSVTPQTVAPQSMEFYRQEYWSGLLFPSPEDLPNFGTGSSALQADSLPSKPPGKSHPSLSVQFSSVAQSCPTLCDPMNPSTTGLPVHHQLLEFTQTHVHHISEGIQLSHPRHPFLLLPVIFPNIQVFSNESSLRQVAKVLELQLQHQSFQ